MNSNKLVEANLHFRQPTSDLRVESQRRRYNLPVDASLNELSEVALPLLEEGQTILEGCELVLGCHIEPTERRRAVLLALDPKISAKERLKILQREAVGVDIGPY